MERGFASRVSNQWLVTEEAFTLEIYNNIWKAWEPSPGSSDSASSSQYGDAGNDDDYSDYDDSEAIIFSPEKKQERQVNWKL